MIRVEVVTEALWFIQDDALDEVYSFVLKRARDHVARLELAKGSDSGKQKSRAKDRPSKPG